jgi:hypothetical protein
MAAVVYDDDATGSTAIALDPVAARAVFGRVSGDIVIFDVSRGVVTRRIGREVAYFFLDGLNDSLCGFGNPTPVCY